MHALLGAFWGSRPRLLVPSHIFNSYPYISHPCRPCLPQSPHRARGAWAAGVVAGGAAAGEAAAGELALLLLPSGAIAFLVDSAKVSTFVLSKAFAVRRGLKVLDCGLSRGSGNGSRLDRSGGGWGWWIWREDCFALEATLGRGVGYVGVARRAQPRRNASPAASGETIVVSTRCRAAPSCTTMSILAASTCPATSLASSGRVCSIRGFGSSVLVAKAATHFTTLSWRMMRPPPGAQHS